MAEALGNEDEYRQRYIKYLVDRENKNTSGKEVWKWHAMQPSPVNVFRNSSGKTENNWELIAQNDIGDYLVWQFTGMDKQPSIKKLSPGQLEPVNTSREIAVHPDVDVRRFYENNVAAEQRKIPILSEEKLEAIASLLADRMVKNLLIAFPDVVDIRDTKSDLDAQCRSKVVGGYIKDYCLNHFENPIRVSHAHLQEADEAYLRDLRLRLWDIIEIKIDILFHKEREHEIKKPNGIIDQFCEEVGDLCGYKAYSLHPNPFEAGLDIEDVIIQLAFEQIEKRKRQKQSIFYVFKKMEDVEFMKEKFQGIIDIAMKTYKQLTEEES